MEQKSKLRDYNLLVDVHILLAHNYFSKESYTNSLKCLQYIMVEYYNNKKICNESKNCLQVSKVYALMANIYRKKSKFEEALHYVEKSIKIVHSTFEGSKSRNLNFCVSYITRGKIYYDMEKFDEAEKDFFFAQRTYQENVKYGEFCSLRYGQLFKDLGNIEAKKNHFHKALNLYKKSLENLEEIYPDMIHKNTSATLNDMANICITFKKYDLADEYLEKALDINQKLIHGEESVEISTNYHTWGNLYAHRQKFEEALENYFKAQEIAINCLKGEENVDVARTKFQIGIVYKKLKDWKNATQYFKEALKIFSKLFKSQEKKNKLVVRCEKELGNIQAQIDRVEVDRMIEEQKARNG